MDVNITRNGSELLVELDGRLDTNAAPGLGEELSVVDETIDKVTFDMEKLDYIASSGLRVLLTTLKKVAPQGGEVIILKPNDMIADVLEATGLDDLFIIEK